MPLDAALFLYNRNSAEDSRTKTLSFSMIRVGIKSDKRTMGMHLETKRPKGRARAVLPSSLKFAATEVKAHRPGSSSDARTRGIGIFSRSTRAWGGWGINLPLTNYLDS